MLDFDFKPLEEETTPSGGDKRLRWGTALIVVLTLLTMAFAYLYVATLQKLEMAKSKLDDLEAVVAKDTLRDSTFYEFNPSMVILRGIIRGQKQTSVILEDKWERSYVLTHNSIVADWRIVVKGDSVWCVSMREPWRKVQIKRQEGE